MPYYVRAFCTATGPPAMNSVLRSLRQRGLNLTAQVDDPSELDSPRWQQCELVYKAEKGPIVVECDRDDGHASLAKAECEEFIQALAELDETPAKNSVIDHLRKTRFIVSCQLLSDIDEDGYEANGQFLDYFVNLCGAMIHADGEGFYERMDLASLLLPLK